jgi:hypothetical protein
MQQVYLLLTGRLWPTLKIEVGWIVILSLILSVILNTLGHNKHVHSQRPMFKSYQNYEHDIT